MKCSDGLRQNEREYISARDRERRGRTLTSFYGVEHPLPLRDPQLDSVPDETRFKHPDQDFHSEVW